MSVADIHRLSYIDPWFLTHLAEIVELEEALRGKSGLSTVSDQLLRTAKQAGFSDRQLATHLGQAGTGDSPASQGPRHRGDVQSVDTCAAEFEAYTPYYYSTYEQEDETPAESPGQRGGSMIWAADPTASARESSSTTAVATPAYALRKMGIQSIMVNSNPETVSTDYDTSDLLFFEPLTTEDVLNICDRVQPDGVIVQFGGQTPLNLARALESAGVPIIGTSVDTIDEAEDREKFAELLRRLGLKQPPNGMARTMAEARNEAAKIGYPVLVRAEFRAGGPGDGNLLRQGPARALHCRGLHRRPGPAGADRQIPGRRHRGRRRRHLRRQET